MIAHESIDGVLAALEYGINPGQLNPYSEKNAFEVLCEKPGKRGGEIMALLKAHGSPEGLALGLDKLIRRGDNERLVSWMTKEAMSIAGKDSGLLERAIITGNIQALDLLLDVGADPNSCVGILKLPLLHVAAGRPDIAGAAILSLISHGADVQKRGGSDGEWTAMHSAKSGEAIDILAKFGLSAQRENKVNHISPLMHAWAVEVEGSCVRAFLDAGATLEDGPDHSALAKNPHHPMTNPLRAAWRRKALMRYNVATERKEARKGNL